MHLCKLSSVSLFLYISCFSWILYISLFCFYFIPRTLDNECNDNGDGQLEPNFDQFINSDDLDDVDVTEYPLPPDLMRLIEKEDKQILPHKEATELVNLGDDNEQKEVKIGTSLSIGQKEELVQLLQEYADVFAWSYQDMPGLNGPALEQPTLLSWVSVLGWPWSVCWLLGSLG